jgi:hypothetical protein
MTISISIRSFLRLESQHLTRNDSLPHKPTNETVRGLPLRGNKRMVEEAFQRRIIEMQIPCPPEPAFQQLLSEWFHAL